MQRRDLTAALYALVLLLALAVISLAWIWTQAGGVGRFSHQPGVAVAWGVAVAGLADDAGRRTALKVQTDLIQQGDLPTLLVVVDRATNELVELRLDLLGNILPEVAALAAFAGRAEENDAAKPAPAA